MSTPRVKVAIIGSGLTGLTVAHLLATTKSPNVEFEVHIFEKAASIGMDDNSITVPSQNPLEEEDLRIDVPMRSFQGGYYPNLIAFYKSLGVQFRPADYTYSFSSLRRLLSSSAPYFSTRLIYNGRSGLGGITVPAGTIPPYSVEGHATPFFALLLALVFITIPSLVMFAVSGLQLLYNFLRLSVISLPIFYSANSTETFREWADRTTPRGYLARFLRADTSWVDFVHEVVVPLFSAVCTASEVDIYGHPAAEILEYIWQTQFTHHYVVTNGVQDAVQRLTQCIPSQNIHLSTTITNISPSMTNSATAKFSFNTLRGAQTIDGFDHIVIATQANSAIPLLEAFASTMPKSPQRRSIQHQISCLRRFKYVRTVVVNHTDDALLPYDPSDRRDLNLVSLDRGAVPRKFDNQHDASGICVPPTYTMATHVIRPARPNGRKAIYQTTNPIIPPRPDSILSTAIMERAVLTSDAKLAQRHLMTTSTSSVLGRRRSALGPLQGAGRRDHHGVPGVWLCGSYAHPGIPLLEACVTSARNVVENGIYAVEGIRTRATWAPP